MATPDNNQAPHTTVNKTSGTGSGIVIGVLVVLVLGFGFYFFAGGNPMDDSGDINVNVDNLHRLHTKDKRREYCFQPIDERLQRRFL